MSKLHSNAASSLFLASVISVANIANAQEPIPSPETARDEPDAGVDVGTGGTTSDAGRGTGGSSAPATAAAAGGAQQGGGTRVMLGPDMNGCACRTAPARGAKGSPTEILLFVAAAMAAGRRRLG